jgi:hypothetical protein
MSDPYLIHEALDRCHVINCMVNDHLLGHPAVGLNLEAHDLIRKASDLLGQAYQLLCHQQDKVLK